MAQFHWSIRVLRNLCWSEEGCTGFIATPVYLWVMNVCRETIKETVNVRIKCCLFLQTCTQRISTGIEETRRGQVVNGLAAIRQPSAGLYSSVLCGCSRVVTEGARSQRSVGRLTRSVHTAHCQTVASQKLAPDMWGQRKSELN